MTSTNTAMSLYDEDILVWSERQAEILRDLARTRRDLPNDFDIENVAEEIESVGRDQLQGVESFILLILVHAIKLAAVPHSNAARGWGEEMLNFHSQALLRLTPSMPRRIDLQRCWRRAVAQTSKALALWGDPVLDLPESCPVPLDWLIGEDIAIDRIVTAVRESAAKPSRPTER